MAIPLVTHPKQGQYNYKSGTIKIEQVITNTNHTTYETVHDGVFTTRKELRKLIVKFVGKSAVVTVNFDEPSFTRKPLLPAKDSD